MLMLTAAESKCGSSNPDQISSVAEKTGRCREVHLVAFNFGTRFTRHCLCREVG